MIICSNRVTHDPISVPTMIVQAPDRKSNLIATSKHKLNLLISQIIDADVKAAVVVCKI